MSDFGKFIFEISLITNNIICKYPLKNEKSPLRNTQTSQISRKKSNREKKNKQKNVEMKMSSLQNVSRSEKRESTFSFFRLLCARPLVIESHLLINIEVFVITQFVSLTLN